MIFPVVGQTLVEAGIVLFGNFFGLLHPDRLVLVKLFKLS